MGRVVVGTDVPEVDVDVAVAPAFVPPVEVVVDVVLFVAAVFILSFKFLSFALPQWYCDNYIEVVVGELGYTPRGRWRCVPYLVLPVQGWN